MTNALNLTPVKTACIIVAGGFGTRLGGKEPKQFMPLGDETVIAWSVRFFGNHASISQVIVVVPACWEEHAADHLDNVEVSVPLKIVTGGARRQDSVLAGIQAATGADFVAVHDGARPFPPQNLAEAIAEAASSGGAIYAIPATDSIKMVNEQRIQKTIPRDGLWAAQTPQIFSRAKLLEALDKCNSQSIELTDDASAFEHMKWPVSIVMGSRSNLKITYPEDFCMAEAILKGRKQ